ncbi:MAG: hypothetical protein DRJ52_04060 [Thermoprotei archaeon]|nr:MAG: hypothetical protein DRJ52_04060 [Thermoprotei archaeon]
MLDEVLFIAVSLIALLITLQIAQSIIQIAINARNSFYLVECKCLYNATYVSGGEWVLLFPYPYNQSFILRVGYER